MHIYVISEIFHALHVKSVVDLRRETYRRKLTEVFILKSFAWKPGSLSLVFFFGISDPVLSLAKMNF